MGGKFFETNFHNFILAHHDWIEQNFLKMSNTKDLKACHKTQGTKQNKAEKNVKYFKFQVEVNV